MSIFRGVLPRAFGRPQDCMNENPIAGFDCLAAGCACMVQEARCCRRGCHQQWSLDIDTGKVDNRRTCSADLIKSGLRQLPKKGAHRGDPIPF